MDNAQNKIYFCGSIRGGRNDQQLYSDLIEFLQTYGTVLTAHVGEKDLSTDHELSSREIYDRDMVWMAQADIVVAEVSTPSHGVGYEIARAVSLKKKILCLYNAGNGPSLSAMIAGCPDVQTLGYYTVEEAKKAIKDFINIK